MRFTLLAFAALAVACIVSASSSDVADEEIQVIHSGGDPTGDEDYTPPVRRNKKHQKHKKHAHKSGRKSNDFVSSTVAAGSKMLNGETMITWYASHDLQNPACGDANGSYKPNNGNHIGAVMAGWNLGDNALGCGKFVDLCNEHKTPHKCVKVRIIDKCAGCAKNHVDLSKSAFLHLSNTGTLDEGETHGLKLYSTSHPNPWDADLFGPLKLQ